MADDEKLLTIKWENDPGTVVEDSGKMGDAAGKSYKEKFEAATKNLVTGTPQTDKAIGPLSDLMAKVTKEHIAKLQPQPLTSGPVKHEATAAHQEVMKRIEPAVAVFEGIAALFRHGSIGFVANQLLKPFLERAEERAGAGKIGTVTTPVMLQPGQLLAPELAKVSKAAGASLADAFKGRMLETVTGAALGNALIPGGPGLLGGAILGGGGPPGLAIGATLGVAGVKLVYDAAEALHEFGVESARTNIELHDMSKIMGITPEKFLDMSIQATHAGVNVEEFKQSFIRLGVTAQRQMPEIQKKYEDAGRTIAESNLKVKESQVGLAQAGINLQFAPQQQVLQDIQGPLTVQGAQFGVQGAGFAVAEARERYRQVMFGDMPDPDVVKRRQQAQAKLALDQAKYSEEQAQLRKQEADMAEEKRLMMQQAGLGPEQQAQQQFEMARLNAEKQQVEAQRLRYGLPSEVEKMLTAGQPITGVEAGKIEPEALREAVFKMGGGEAGGIIDVTKQLLAGPFAGLTDAEKVGQLGKIIPQIQRGPQAGGWLDFFQSGGANLTKEEKDWRTGVLERLDQGLPSSRRTVAEEEFQKLQVKYGGAAVGVGEGVQSTTRAFGDVATGIKTAGFGVVNALNTVAGGIRGTTGVEGGGGDKSKGDDEDNMVGGGLVGGYGSGTSDSNLIHASKGEYMIRADGSNLDDAVRHFIPGYAGGGEIDPNDPLGYKRTHLYRSAIKKIKRDKPSWAYQAPKAFHPMHPEHETEKAPFTGPGVAPKTAAATKGPGPWGGYANEQQMKLAADYELRMRTRDFDPKNVQEYLKQLQAGKTVEELREERKQAVLAPHPAVYRLPDQFPGPMVRVTQEDAIRASRQEFLDRQTSAEPVPLPREAPVPLPREAPGPPGLVSRFMDALTSESKGFSPPEIKPAGEKKEKETAEGYAEGGEIKNAEDYLKSLQEEKQMTHEGEGVSGVGEGINVPPEAISMAAQKAIGWGTSAARFLAPELPMAADMALGATSPAMTLGQFGALLYSESHKHEPMTLNEVLRMHRGSSVREREQQRFREGVAADADRYAEGGLIRASKGEYLVSADGSNLGDAISHFTRGYQGGGPIDVSNLMLRNTQPAQDTHLQPGPEALGLEEGAARLASSFAAGVAQMESTMPGPYVAGGGGGGGMAGYHQLDIRTNQGSFSAMIAPDTMTALQSSALGAKISSTGQRPSWYS
jgi:hypothetical protein